ncbi:hypothetical protein NIASO_05150 [Niabella soli DSM 19437]|uniref:TTHB210-like domain-containing protein n=2 Tax=Niabella TaxID=379899 RepID=W0EZX7_9BACT|nr:hypothetical protein NIASO_05150 [Niabella soli DSM 19437]
MAAGLLLSSCTKETAPLNDHNAGASAAMVAGLHPGSSAKVLGMPGGKVYTGPEVSFKKGKVTTLYQVDDAAHPLRLAISINNDAWNSLDMPAPGGSNNISPNTVILPFHPKVDARIFNHAELDWNPNGHEPVQIYGKPHFDFHFYNVSLAYVDAIPPYDLAPAKFDNWPALDYLPANYINPGGGVPQMGCHWVDTTSAEFTPQGFGQTFIYGTYDGKVTFLEPMITKAFFETHPEFKRSIPQPKKVAISGYYPTMVEIQKTTEGYLVILEDFVYREAS